MVDSVWPAEHRRIAAAAPAAAHRVDERKPKGRRTAAEPQHRGQPDADAIRSRRAATGSFPDAANTRPPSNRSTRSESRRRDPFQAVGELSGGNQQKVALGRLLHHDADILLLDEPTRGIDVGSKAEIYAIVGELARRGKAIVFVSSYLPELLGRVRHHRSDVPRPDDGDSAVHARGPSTHMMAAALGQMEQAT